MGRAAIRATNTGISGFISHTGKILDAGPQFEAVTLTMAVQPRMGSTPYAGTGNLPILVLCLLIMAGTWLRMRAGL